LIVGRWYVGRGRNANVALWGPVTRGHVRLTFLTIGHNMQGATLKDEGYFANTGGCFQPFLLVDEGTVAEPFSHKPGWDQHYAKTLSVPTPTQPNAQGEAQPPARKL